MKNSAAHNRNEGCIYGRAVRKLRSNGIAPPAEFDGRWDRDTVSGHLLHLFRMTGNDACFEAFYRLNLKRLTLQLARSPYASAWNFDHMEMAADIFYDIFHAAHTFTFRGGVSFRAWMRVITRNKIKKTLRNRSAFPTVRLDFVEEIGEIVTSDPLRLLIHRERYCSVLGGCRLLVFLCARGIGTATTDQEEEVLRLHESEGLSYKAISKRLDIPLREVVRIGRRGRRKVAGYIRKQVRNALRHGGRAH